MLIINLQHFLYSYFKSFALMCERDDNLLGLAGFNFSIIKYLLGHMHRPREPLQSA